jgi:hypothetical protein
MSVCHSRTARREERAHVFGEFYGSLDRQHMSRTRDRDKLRAGNGVAQPLCR